MNLELRCSTRSHIVSAGSDWVGAGYHGRPCRRADRDRRVGAPKYNALGGQRIDVRRLDELLIIGAVPGRLIVDIDPEDVGFDPVRDTYRCQAG